MATPEEIQAAIDQAEKEAEVRADHADMELIRPKAETVVIAGRKARPLSAARKLIMGRIIRSVEGDEEKPTGEILSEEEQAAILVLILFTESNSELFRLARKPERFLKKAYSLVDSVGLDVFGEMANYAADEINRLGLAVEMSGEPDRDDAGGSAGNAVG